MSLGGRQGAFYQHALQQNITESLEPPSLALLFIVEGKHAFQATVFTKYSILAKNAIPSNFT